MFLKRDNVVHFQNDDTASAQSKGQSSRTGSRRCILLLAQRLECDELEFGVHAVACLNLKLEMDRHPAYDEHMKLSHQLDVCGRSFTRRAVWRVYPSPDGGTSQREKEKPNVPILRATH